MSNLQALGAAIAQGLENLYSRETSQPSILEQPVDAPKRKLKVVCLGAGMAGLIITHKILHEEGWRDMIDLTVYEKNPDVGGVWYENSYPGVAW